MGWRRYKDINDTLVLFYGRPQSGEMPNASYSFTINYGLTKKRWRYMLGLEYNYVKYHNNNASRYQIVDNGPPWKPRFDTVLVSYKYSYTHQLVSIPFSANYLFGKNKSWYIGGVLKFSWLIKYSRRINNTVDLTSSYPVLWSGITFGKRIIETRKLNFNIGCGINYSTLVGANTLTIGRSSNPNGGISVAPPNYIQVYESTPHNLLVPSIQFSLQYKL